MPAKQRSIANTSVMGVFQSVRPPRGLAGLSRDGDCARADTGLRQADNGVALSLRQEGAVHGVGI